MAAHAIEGRVASAEHTHPRALPCANPLSGYLAGYFVAC